MKQKVSYSFESGRVLTTAQSYQTAQIRRVDWSIYGCVLGCFEVRNLKIADLNFDKGRAYRKCVVDIFGEEPACRGDSRKGRLR